MIVESIPNRIETNGHYEELHFDRREEFGSLLELVVHRETLRQEVEAVNVGAIGEVVDVVARQRVDAVVDGALEGAGAGPREVSLEGWRARVQVGHDVGVVGPHVAESLLEVRLELGEWVRARRNSNPRNTRRNQLLVKDIT